MSRYLWRVLRAHLRQGRTLTLLTAGGVALGVASVLCVQILNRGALGAFEGSLQAISGESDLSVTGHLPTIPERIYPRVLAVPGVAAAWPFLRVDAALSERPDLFVEILGFDLFAPVRLPLDGHAELAAGPLSTPGWCAVTPELAGRMGWEVGDRFEVIAGADRVEMEVGALVDFRRVSPLASSRMMVMDIAQAQDLFDARGRLAQVEVQAAAGQDVAELADRLRAALGEGFTVATPEQRMGQAASLLGAFRLNLTALSLISVIVGVFLVHSSTHASLVRRRGEFGLLRSLGASRGQVLTVILVEVSLLGLLGTAVGIPVGYLAASANLERVSQTVENLYALEAIEHLEIPAWLLLVAAGIGIGGALVGAILPALDMARRDSRALLAAYTLHERAGKTSLRLFLAGSLLALGGVAWYVVLGIEGRFSGFAVALLVLIVIPLLTPSLVVRAGTVWRVRGLGLGYSIRSLTAQLRVSAFAVAALAVAVSMLVGITVMIASFRTTLDTWVGSTVRADVYLSSQGWRGGELGALPPELVTALAARPEVLAVDRLRRTLSDVGGRRVTVGAIDMGLSLPEERFALLQGEPAEAARQAREEGALLISEPLSRGVGVGRGDTIVLAGPEGPLSFPVAGVFYDYGNESGSVLLDLATMAQRFGPGDAHSIALYLQPDADAEQVSDAIRAAFPEMPLQVRSNRRLRADVLEVFDRTFAITRFLQAVCLLIAVCGVTLTLLVLARERVSELALYRALGARRRQILRIFLGKGVAMAGLGILLGSAAGGVLALVLVFGINRAWFGWTLRMHWPWGALLGQAVAILAAAALAALYPAARASRTPATELSREEVA